VLSTDILLTGLPKSRVVSFFDLMLRNMVHKADVP
jgi:hypothetical protein